uniref:Homeobox D8 n=1 Tax=Rhinopithecus bieti TaxID=61621 RepID=A0A2K6LNF1_RHIBE
MSSYFVNPLYSKYKAAAAAGEAINPTYYDCHFAPEVGGRHATAAAALQLYGNSAAGFPQAHAHPHPSPPPSGPGCGGGGGPGQDYFHPGGAPAKFYGYDNLQRQPIFTTQQEAELVQYPDCKSSSGNIGEDPDHLNQSSSPSQMFPWMRPQAAPGRRRGRQTYSRFQTLEKEESRFPTAEGPTN